MTTRKNMKPDYGNWVPKRLLYGLLIAVLITMALLIGALAAGWAWPWRVFVAILLVVSAGFLCYMTNTFQNEHLRNGFDPAKAIEF